jgi:hypothetical protein
MIWRPDVVAYVAAVRDHLDDLPADVVEELTGGLEADLGDLAAESSDPLEQRIGAPTAYADELRAAAGLEPRGARSRTTAGQRLAALTRELRAQPWWPAASAFALTVRPAWWVARALLAVWALHRGVLGVTGLGVGWWLVGAGAVVVSVELGRGRWSTQRWLRPLVLLGNVLAVLVALVWLAGSGAAQGQDLSAGQAASVPGLAVNGTQVTNVYAYDAQGRPLSDVQLFDQSGQPLGVDQNLSLPLSDGSYGQPAPAHDAYGRMLYNVFPLRTVSSPYSTDGATLPGRVSLAAPPFVAASPVIVPSVGPVVDPSAGAPTSPAPTSPAPTSPALTSPALTSPALTSPALTSPTTSPPVTATR